MTSLARIDVVTSGWQGGPGLSSFFFRGAGGTPTDAEVDDALGRVRGFYDAQKALFPSAWVATVNGSVPIINADNGVLQSVKVRAAPSLVVGTSANGFGPPNLMALARWNTNAVFNGHRVKGRTFIGPFNLALTNANVPGASIGSAITTGGLSLFTGATGAVFVIWHRPKGANLGNYGDVFLPATTAPFWSQLKSRRDS